MSNFSWLRLGLLGTALALPAMLPAEDKPAPEKNPPRPEADKKAPDAKGPEQLFRELDKNNDGKITADEVGPDHRRHFDHLLREAGKTEKDGLTRDQFLKGLQPEERRIKGVPDFGGREGRRGEGNFDPGQMFERWDRNKDGKVTLDEVPDQFRDRLRPVFERLKKESLTRDEFVNARGSLGGMFNPEEFFKRLDRNGDGKLSLNEAPERLRERFPEALKQAGKKEGESLTREEFQKFLARGPRDGFGGRDGGMQVGNPEEFVKRHDKNGDGKVTLDEVDGRMRNGFERILERLKKDPDAALTVDDLRKVQGMELARGQGDRPGEKGRMPREGGEGEMRRDGGRPPGFPPQSPLLKLLDANHDGKITKDEMARIAEVFEKLDTNHDGALDPFELMGPPPQRRLSDRGEGMDRGGPDNRNPPPRDGEARRPGDAKPDGPPDGEGKGKEDRKFGGRGRFERLDVDQDRKLSRTEARGPLLKNFDKFDTNKDGFLDRDEIRKGRQELGLGEGGRPGEGDKKPADGEKKPAPDSESK